MARQGLKSGTGKLFLSPESGFDFPKKIVDQIWAIGHRSYLSSDSGFESSVRVFLKNAQHILNRLRILMGGMIRRDDVFGPGTIHMRTPIRHDSIAGIR